MNDYTLLELIDLLNQKVFTSCDLVNMYIKQIQTYDSYLNAIAEINPDALAIASKRDEERNNGIIRSPLHGIPILIKDNINTNDLMHTTASSLALSDLHANYDATIVERLIESGAVILGKANLSEFAYFMSTEKMPSGYGSRHGQVKSPYHEKIDPLGSSTGSAVSVAANMIPISIGTETNGSLMAPAYQNSIVSIKPTLGMVSRYGIIPISSQQDTAGPMAKTVADCAILLEAIAGYDPHDEITKDALIYKEGLGKSYLLPVIDKKVGIISFSNYPYKDEDTAILLEAKEKLTQAGLRVIDIEIELEDLKNFDTLIYEFKHDINHYLQSVSGQTRMKSLEDIINFNFEDPERRLKYGQNILIDANQTEGLEDPKYLQMKKDKITKASLFEKLLRKHQCDALISTYWLSYAPMFGNPSICVPAKALVDQSPKSIVFVGKKWDDASLISIAHTYEQLTKHRIPPKIITK
jgi:amidase